MTTLSESYTGILKEPSINEMDRWVSWLLIQHPSLNYGEAVREWIWRSMKEPFGCIEQKEKT